MKRKRSIAMLPSLCTTANLFCGFFSMTKTLSGDYVLASYLVILASFFDLIDGSIARLAHAETKFGLAYDSLVDLISFGVAPGLLMYIWSLQSLGRIGALATFVFIACGALRLARYNVQHDNIESKFFQGLPIPSAAGILITFVIFCEGFLEQQLTENYFVVSLPVIAGLLMVSSINYRSLKTLNFRGGKNAFLLLVAFVLFLFIISLNPDLMLFLMLMTYVASGVIEELITLRESKKLVARIREQREQKKSEHLKVVNGQKE